MNINPIQEKDWIFVQSKTDPSDHPYFTSTHIIEVTDENKSDVPNITKGCDVFLRKQDTCQAGDFIVTKEGHITQAKEKMEVFGVITYLSMWDHKMPKTPIIHNGNNWYGRSPDDMKRINETYKIRSQADADKWQQEEDKINQKMAAEVNRAVA